MNCLVHKFKRKDAHLKCSTAYRFYKCRCNNCKEWNTASAKEWRDKHPEKHKEQQRIRNKRFFSSSKGKIAMSKAFYKRYDKTELWMEHWTTDNHAAWEALITERDRLTRETGVSHHIDHIVPLGVGGPHHPANCRVITAEENLKRPKDGSDLGHG